MPERILRPGILTSDRVSRLSWPGEVFYRRLMSVVDDYGRFDGRISILRAACYPLQLSKVSDSDIGKWRLETANAGLVRIYCVDAKEFVELADFRQRMRAAKSRYPAPLENAGHCHADAGQCHDNANGGGGGGGDDSPKPPRGPAGGKSKTPASDEAKRISAMFGRRETTEWSEKEIRAFRSLGEIEVSDLLLLEGYHAAEKAKGDSGRHRRDLCTLLNNFRSEIDRAREWSARAKRKSTAQGSLL